MIKVSKNLRFFSVVLSQIDHHVREAGRLYQPTSQANPLYEYECASQIGREFLNTQLPRHYLPFKDLIENKLEDIAIAAKGIMCRPLTLRELKKVGAQ